MKDNKLIAEFMGVKPLHMGGSVEYEIYGILDFIEDGIDKKHFFLEEELEFHSSWDWLMPVVDKCFDTHFEHSDDLSFLLKTFKPLEEVYKAVVEFINRTKKGA